MSARDPIDQAAELVANEVMARLEDDERRSKLPDHVVFKALSDVSKILDKRPEVPEVVEPDLLEIVDLPDYPVAKKQALVMAECRRLRERLRTLEDWLGRNAE